MTVTCAGLGTAAGAVYRPLDETVPQADPEHPAPATFQVTAVSVVPVTVAVNCCLFPTTICAVVGARWIVTTGRIVTDTDADLVLLAFEVAVTVTAAGLGTAAGAVKRPLEEIEPQAAPEQPVPLRLHVTAVSVVPVTVAVNFCVAPTSTFAVLGDMLMATGGTTVTVEVADFAESATEVALTVTCAGTGTAVGAVYNPLDETVPQALPEQPLPLTDQVTLVLDVPPTVAVNCCVFPATTCALPGDTLTTISCRMVTAAVADLAVSATEVTVTLTCAGLGTAAGAV